MSAARRRRPRIAWVVPTMSAGGTEMQLVQLMRGLAADFELTLVCTRSAGALIGDARRSGAYVRVLNYRGGWDFRMESKLRHIFEAHTPDILHSFMSGFDLFPNRAARAAGVKVILSSRRELAAWQKRRHVWMQRRANRYVDGIIANSRAAADYAVQREHADPGLFHVILNGVHADSFLRRIPPAMVRERFKIPPNGLVVGMVANFSPVKDHRLFVDMAANLLQRRKDLHFLLVGGGPGVAECKRIIERRGLQDHFTRHSTVAEMADLLCAMDLCVLTSKVEGCPNAILEAMAAGRPVVAAAVGGIPELIQDGLTGRLISSRAPADFADAVASLLDDPNLRGQMGSRAAAWVRETLPIEAMVDQYRALYLDLLHAKLTVRP